MKKKTRIMSFLAGGVVLAIPVGIVALGSWDTQDSASILPAVVQPIPIAVVLPSSGNRTRVFPGQVRACQRVELAFSVPGLLENLNAAEGCGVEQGEILARLDRRDYQYALDMATARFKKADRELARYSKLRKQKVAAEVEYENAQTDYNIALAELRMRQKALEDTILRAPFKGIVARRHVENHEHVRAKQAIVSFQDISRIEVVIQVPERLIAHGGTDTLGEIQVRFDADNDQWFDAAVSEHRAKSDRVTHTYDVVVGLTPPSDLMVFPGMTVTVKANIWVTPMASIPEEGFTLVPAEALCRGDNGESHVWVIDPTGGTPVKRAVETVRLWGGSVEIRSGLIPGERVAVAGLHKLREGILVRPMACGKEGLDG